jgi:hypothetical protein
VNRLERSGFDPLRPLVIAMVLCALAALVTLILLLSSGQRARRLYRKRLLAFWNTPSTEAPITGPDGQAGPGRLTQWWELRI